VPEQELTQLLSKNMATKEKLTEMEKKFITMETEVQKIREAALEQEKKNEEWTAQILDREELLVASKAAEIPDDPVVTKVEPTKAPSEALVKLGADTLDSLFTDEPRSEPPASDPEPPQLTPVDKPAQEVPCFACGTPIPVPDGPKPVVVECPKCHTRGNIE